MGRVSYLARKTSTSVEAVAKRAAEAIVDELPAVVDRVFETDNASGLVITINVKPGGRTEGAKDPEVVIKARPKHGESVVKIKAKMTGEYGADAQLSLIQDLQPVGDTDDGEDGEDEAATG